MKLRLAVVAAFAAFAALGAEPELAPLGPHPRLFADDAEFAAAKARLEASPEGRAALGCVMKTADSCLAEPVLERRKIGRRLLDASRKALGRMAHLAFAWRATGDCRYLDRAVAEARAISAFSDWNPSHFLDVGEMTLAVAIARDWLDGALSDEDRRLFSEAILMKGLTKGDGSTLHAGWWTRSGNNWNQVCNGGLAAGAAAVREDCPDVAEAVLRRSRECLPFGMKAYAGGNFPEGPGYWEYATDFMVIALDVLERQFSDGAPELFAAAGLAEQVDYMDLMTGPTGLLFNYSDPFGSHVAKRHPVAANWYLARRFNRPDALLRCELPLVRRGFGCGRMTPFMLLWIRSIDAVEPAYGRCVVLGGENPVAVMREGTGWKSWYVGIKGGRPSVNHGHMDGGSFVLDAGGARWACDLGCEDYNRIEQMKTVSLWSMKQESSRWSLFRLNAEGHGTLTIDGAPQKVDGCASISGDGPVTVNLTPLYPGAREVKRSFALSPDGLRVEDSLSGLRPGAVVAWNMNTAAKARSDGNALFLEAKDAKGETVRMMLTAEPADAKWEVFSIVEPRTPADSPNPGMTRVAFRTVAGESGMLDLAVAFRMANVGTS